MFYLHKHRPEFDEVTVIWILYFYYAPWIHAATNFSTTNLYNCARPYHSKRHCFLQTYIVAGSLESANSSILLARNLFKDFGGEKIRILC